MDQLQFKTLFSRIEGKRKRKFAYLTEDDFLYDDSRLYELFTTLKKNPNKIKGIVEYIVR